MTLQAANVAVQQFIFSTPNVSDDDVDDGAQRRPCSVRGLHKASITKTGEAIGFYVQSSLVDPVNTYVIAFRSRANTLQKVASCVVVKLMRMRVLGLRTA